jgi:hypothetical protein
VTAATLLRAVGHMLDKVDTRSDPKLRKAMNDRWKQLLASKPHPPIFLEFIVKERDLILKEYDIRAGQGATVNLGTRKVINHYLINDGPFKGREQREVLRDAVAWWESYLAGIEHDVAQHARAADSLFRFASLAAECKALGGRARRD